MMNSFNYPAKLLLFGEYSIIKGSQALAIPLDIYSGHWSYGTTIHQGLVDLAQYLGVLEQQGDLLANLDIAALKTELNNNLYFQSSIPQGYGLGSSGALCAAIYQRFGKHQKQDENTLSQLVKILAQIESYFHGASSGIDPLVCYLNQALLIQSKSSVKRIDLPQASASASYTIFLLDTHMARETEPLVKLFLKKCDNALYNQQLIDQYIPLVHRAIDNFLAAQTENLFEVFHQISAFQIQAFNAMIPSSFQKIWKTGLDQKEYKLKLCGAGGGGFILGISKDFEKTKQLLSDYNLIAVINV